MKAPSALLDAPVEVCIMRDSKPLMTQIFQHTPIRFGRILDNDIVLPFESISRHHCELHFENGKWTLKDLQSLNGVQVNGERVSSATFENLGAFELEPVTIQLRLVKATTHTQTRRVESSTEAATLISGSEVTLIGTDPQIAAAKRLHQEKKPDDRKREEKSAHAESARKKQPVLNVNALQMMGDTHGMIERAKSRAVQVSVVWHDVILSVDEFLPEEDMIIEINGICLRLGRVGRDRSEIRCPTGTSFIDRPGQQSTLLPTSPASWMAENGIKILARYAPQAKNKPSGLASFIDNELVDPLVISGLVHGAMAIATMTMSAKQTAPPKLIPERVASIITQPVPKPTPPMIAKATPTPAPIPTPTPKPIVQVKPTPKPIVRATPKPKPIVAAKPPPKPPQAEKKQEAAKPPVEKKVAKLNPPPPAPKVEAPPAPTPKPFNAASVGALKALSMLSQDRAPATIEKIVVKKAPVDEDGGASGSPSPTTSQMLNNLPASTDGASSGSGMGLAVSKTGAGYGTGGFSGKTGKRNVLGSIIGGATYTAPTKTEGLTREQVMKVVQKHHAQIQQCYERSLMDDSTLAGRAEFEWEISSKGTVSAGSVGVKETTLKNGEKLIDCVKGVFLAMSFPTAKNGSSTTPTIGLPFGRL